jgi:uncharacterized membrane protein
MTPNQLDIRTGVVRPITCYKSGWAIIKDQFWLILGVSLVGMLIGSVAPFGILLGPMMCGIYKCLFARSRGEKASFEMLFKGFEHFVQSLIACLVMIVPVFLITIPLTLLLLAQMFVLMKEGAPQSIDPAQFLHGFVPFLVIMIGLVMVVSLALGVLFMFAFPLIVDRGLSGIEALKTSARAALGNLGGLVGLVLLNLLLGLVGMMCCYVGAFFIMPFSFAAILIAYQQVFGPEAPPMAQPQ